MFSLVLRFWCKVTIPSPETSTNRQEHFMNRPKYEHFRLKLFELESFHQSPSSFLIHDPDSS